MVKELINTLSDSEKKSFELWLKARNKRGTDSNIKLFRQFTVGNQKSARDKLGSNAYNVAKKRLSDRLLDFLSNRVLESEVGEEVGVIRLLVLSRRLYAHGNYKIARQVLAKAEKRASELMHYSLLNEIYQTAIHYSYLPESEDQKELFSKAQKNFESFHREMQLNMAHARIRRVFENQEFGRKGNSEDLKMVINAIYEEFNISSEDINNFQTLYQLAQITDVTAFHQKNYYLADLYFIDRIDTLAGTSVDVERTLIYHIDVLYLVANICFRQRKFDQSLEYLERMYTQMSRCNGEFMRERLIQYTTLKALNINFKGNPALAQEVLSGVLESDYYREALLNPLLARVMIYFQQGETDEARKILSSFQHTDSWYRQRVGLDWILNKRYMEILLHIELGNIDYVDSRISSLIRKYGTLFEEEQMNSIRPFLKIIRKYNQDPESVTSIEFKQLVEETIPWRRNGEEDIFLMCFYAWLKARMEKRPLYQVTLELVQRSDF